jgi:hypothetical protein
MKKVQPGDGFQSTLNNTDLETIRLIFREEIQKALKEIYGEKESQPEIEKMPSKQCNEKTEKILKLKQKLNSDGSLLDDLITVSSSANLETITKNYWENFEYITPEMFKEFICQSRNKPYSEKTIKETIKRTKPPAYHREKQKNKKETFQ